MNTKLSIILNNLIKEKKLTVDALTSILNQSKDSVYRRLRGETDFLLNEAFLLADKLELSLDALHKSNTNQKVFQTKHFIRKNDAVETITKYIAELHTDMQNVSNAGVINMYYAAKDLPLFCFFSSTTLTSFKLYFWYITLFDNKDSKVTYQQDWLPQHVLDQATDIYKMYNQTNTTEIWNFETINSSLHQILYCTETGLISVIQAIALLDALQHYLDNVAEYARAEKKKGVGKLTMYLNEILLLDNSVIFDFGFQQIIYMPFQTLNFLSTSDEEFTKQNLAWFQKQIAKSTLISGESQKDRTKLMNHFTKEIAKYRNKIGVED
jgi:hypothetical protein